jgi:hypothetical protein
MADVTITGLPNASALSGTERVPMDQSGTTVDAAASAIAALATAATVGLGNVNNTSDINKPVSTATQTALDGKAAAGAIGSSGLTMTAGVLGRESGTGAPQVFTLGSGLSIVNGALTASGVGGGGYPSLSMPTGFSVSGSGTASLGVTFTAGYSLPTTARQTEWDTAYSERLRWDGNSTGLNATTARTSLGLGTAATAATGDFATAAQGALAATAVQPAALSSYQPLDSDLTSIAALTTTSFGRSLLTQADAAAARTAIGAGTSNLALSSAAPAALAATAAAGSSADAARADHAHARSTYAELGAIGDGLILVVSNRGETATASTNYAEVPVPVPSGSFTLVGVRFGCHIDTTGSSSSTFNAYRRTAAGTKTSVLTGNATLASSASLVDASATITGGTFSAGDRIGVDLVGVGTGAQGLFAQFLFTRSAV